MFRKIIFWTVGMHVALMLALAFGSRFIIHWQFQGVQTAFDRIEQRLASVGLSEADAATLVMERELSLPKAGDAKKVWAEFYAQKLQADIDARYGEIFEPF